MIRNLPEGSRLLAARAANTAADEDLPDMPIDPRTEALMDHRTWTLDRRLKAMEVNALYTLISLTGNWKEGKIPDFPTIGPSDWRPETKTKSEELKDNFDVLRKMGWPGG